MRTWTTEDRAPAGQYPYRREVLRAAFTALDPAAASVASFDSRVAIKDRLDATVSDLRSRTRTKTRARARTGFRGKRGIRGDPGECFFASMQLERRCVVGQGGRQSPMRPGDFDIADRARPRDPVDDGRIPCIRKRHGRSAGDFRRTTLAMRRQP